MDFSQGPALGGVIPHRCPVTSLSYHEDGIHLFAATEQDSKVYMINGQTGQSQNQSAPYMKNERDGISKLCCTHHDYSILSVGPQSNNTILYWSLYDNKILR